MSKGEWPYFVLGAMAMLLWIAGLIVAFHFIVKFW